MSELELSELELLSELALCVEGPELELEPDCEADEEASGKFTLLLSFVKLLVGSSN